MTPEVLTFVHLTKVGGSTLNNIFLKNFGKSGVWRFNTYDVEKGLEEVGEAYRETPERVRLFTGHMAFGAHRYLPGCRYVTLLREPLKRVESCYNHYVKLPLSAKRSFVGIETERDAEELSGKSVSELLQLKIFNQLDNAYVRYLGGDHCRPISVRSKPELDASDLRKAKENLEKHFHVVGILEEYEKFLVMLQHTTAISDILYTEKNRTKASEKQSFSPADLASIEDCNRFDKELYRHAQALMEERFAQLDLDERLSEFKEALDEYKKRSGEEENAKLAEIRKTIAALDKDKKVAVYSSGMHTKKMFELTALEDLNIQCVLDTYKDGEEFNGYPVVNARRLGQEEIDTVIISNFAFQEQIRELLTRQLGFTGEIVSFYRDEDIQPFDDAAI